MTRKSSKDSVICKLEAANKAGKHPSIYHYLYPTWPYQRLRWRCPRRRSESRGRRWAERYLQRCSHCAALMQPCDQIRVHPARHHTSSNGIVRLCRLSSVLLGEIEQVLTWSKIEFRNWTTNLQLAVAQSWCHLGCSPCPPQGLDEKIIQEEVNHKHLRIVSIDWIQFMQKQKLLMDETWQPMHSKELRSIAFSEWYLAVQILDIYRCSHFVHAFWFPT